MTSTPITEAKPAEPAIDVSIEKMVYGGEGLSRTAEGVVLVPGVIAGERARVLPEATRHGVRRGRRLDVSELSSHRVRPECPHYERCGGCQYQHISYARQSDIKREILGECFERIGKFRPEVPIEVLPSEPWHYRNRIRLQVEKDAAGLRVGYRQPASHSLAAVDSCTIAMPALEATVAALANGLLAEQFPEGACELELFCDEAGGSAIATVYSPQPAPPSFGDALREALPVYHSVCWTRQTRVRGQRVHAGETIWGSGAITYRVGEFHYRVSHHSFFQSNAGLLPSMIRAAMGTHSGARALDLYAGAGFFTLPLGRHFETVAAVEASPAAARDLAVNAGVMGTRVRIHHKTAEAFLAATSHNWDLILADPPRAGLSRPVLDGLGRIRPPRIVYVSCDPTTLARDLAALRAGGYQISSIHLADQFPQTFHIETIVHLARAR